MKLLDGFSWFLNPVWVMDKFFTLWGGGGGQQTSTGTTYTSNLPEYAKPFFEQALLSAGKNVFDVNAAGNVAGVKGMPTYSETSQLSGGLSAPGQRVAGLTSGQEAIKQQIAGLQTPEQFAQATAGLTAGQNLGYGAAGAGLNRALSYVPGTISAQNISAPNLQNFGMSAAQANYNPNLTTFQMAGPSNVSGAQLRDFTMSAAAPVGAERTSSATFSPEAANYYMSPYAQAAINPALREARLQGDLQKQAGMLGSIGRGTFGGGRQALLQAEQERGTQRTMADIQATGMEKAYQNAQAQFQADQARGLQSQQANQQAGLQAGLANQQAQQQANVQNLASYLQTQGLSADQAMKAALANQQAQQNTQQQNLQAALGVQQLGTQTGTQFGLANLSNAQQANVQNLAAQLQTQGLSAEQAMKAAMANQQSNLQAQQLTQQGQQYAAGLGKDVGLAGLQAGLEASRAQSATAAAEQTANLERLKTQAASEQERQALDQKILDIEYQQAMEARDWEKKQLEFYNAMLRGTPGLSSTQIQYAPQPSATAQLGGLGLGALGLAKAFG